MASRVIRGPLVDRWFLEELEVIDPLLTLRWDREKAKFWLESVRGNEVVPYGLFEKPDLNRLLLNAIRVGIRRRDQGVSIADRLADAKARRDAEAAVRHKEFQDFCEAQAGREWDAANAGGKVWGQGAPGAPTPAQYGNRIEGMRGTD